MCKQPYFRKFFSKLYGYFAAFVFGSIINNDDFKVYALLLEAQNPLHADRERAFFIITRDNK